MERLALNLFARELAAWRTELVDDLLLEARFGDEGPGSTLQQRAGLYPRVIRDALQTAIRNPQTVNPAPFADLADELESSVLGGQVSATDEEIEFVPEGRTGVSLRLHQTASVVKSLVSLVLFLRYRAVPDTRLIIDEPELNLHPDNQRRVAHILAKAINRGLRIMMSTHSDYVVSELNNLIMLGQNSDRAKTLAAELGYDTRAVLRPEQLGVYLVLDGQCGSIPVTETGFEVETIDKEIHHLNRDSQTIYQRLFARDHSLEACTSHQEYDATPVPGDVQERPRAPEAADHDSPPRRAIPDPVLL
ncbi:MAG: AAA family ATPase [Myxococcota bacterium]